MRKLAVILLLAMSVCALHAADISGTWAAAVVLDAGSGTATFVFDGGPAGKVSFQGTLDGASNMKGTAEYGQLGKGTFTAEKK
jgi:hypothetical protein